MIHWPKQPGPTEPVFIISFRGGLHSLTLKSVGERDVLKEHILNLVGTLSLNCQLKANIPAATAECFGRGGVFSPRSIKFFAFLMRVFRFYREQDMRRQVRWNESLCRASPFTPQTVARHSQRSSALLFYRTCCGGVSVAIDDNSRERHSLNI